MAENDLKLKPRENIPIKNVGKDGSETETNEDGSESSLNDILSALKDKQEEFSQMISDYSIFNKRTLIDVIETSDSIMIKADLPRLKNQDIEIAISEDSVDICVEIQEENKDKNIKYLLRERSFGKIKRSVKLPSKVNAKEAEGTFKNSVLTIKLPKHEKNILRLKID